MVFFGTLNATLGKGLYTFSRGILTNLSQQNFAEGYKKGPSKDPKLIADPLKDFVRLFTLLGTNIFPSEGTFEDIPFPQGVIC